MLDQNRSHKKKGKEHFLSFNALGNVVLLTKLHQAHQAAVFTSCQKAKHLL